ncbi:MAG: hypothetical protein AB7T06_10390 [Kofleriaceae bacterium]
MTLDAGDLFAIPLPTGGFVTGCIVLNPRAPSTKASLGTRSRLAEHGELLLDVFGPVSPEPNTDSSEYLIHGIWTDASRLQGRKGWPILGRRTVDPTKVEFPEYVLRSNNRIMFECGEIFLPLPISDDEFEVVRGGAVYVSIASLPNKCVNLTGGRGLFGEEAILYDLDGRTELRYSPYRPLVYRALGVNPNRSYWDWATSLGLDPGRFWR